jgi:hypothetical protein
VLAYGVHDLQEGGAIGGVFNYAFDVSDQIPPPATRPARSVRWNV